MKIRREKQSPTDKQKYRAHTCAKEACAVSNSSVSGQQRAPLRPFPPLPRRPPGSLWKSCTYVLPFNTKNVTSD